MTRASEYIEVAPHTVVPRYSHVFRSIRQKFGLTRRGLTRAIGQRPSTVAVELFYSETRACSLCPGTSTFSARSVRSSPLTESRSSTSLQRRRSYLSESSEGAMPRDDRSRKRRYIYMSIYLSIYLSISSYI